MRSLKTIALSLFSFIALGCYEQGDRVGLKSSSSILSVTINECYCCPGLSMVIDGEVTFVDTYPQSALVDKAIDDGVFPVEVLVETSAYTGNCPNRKFDITHIELIE